MFATQCERSDIFVRLYAWKGADRIVGIPMASAALEPASRRCPIDETQSGLPGKLEFDHVFRILRS